MGINIRKELKYASRISAIGYLLSSFVRWDLYWILDVGDWDNGDRGALILFSLMCYIIGRGAIEFYHDWR